MKKTKIIIGVVAALAVFLAACGRDSSDDNQSTATETTAAPAAQATTTTASTDPCENETLEDSEIGVSASEITILVMADIGIPGVLGLFQGSIDGTKAWADYINSQGGLACRQVRVLERDTMLQARESENGFLEACEDALALVGSTALFVDSVETLNTCQDRAGNPTGIPDFAERTVAATHACSPNAFTTAGVNARCPVPAEGEDQTRTYSVNRQIDDYLVETHGPLNGVFAIPADLASAINSTMPSIRVASRISGIVNDGDHDVFAGTTQAGYGALLDTMRENDSNFARTNSDDNSMLRWRGEAVAQGGFDDIIWNCSLACYTPNYLSENTEITEGTYLWMSFLPFAEREHNAELDLFLTSIDADDDFPPAWAAGAWASARLFEQAVNDVVDEFGLNGITRARVIAAAQAISSFDANGWFGTIDFTSKPNISPCIVILRIENNQYVRKHPEEPGTLDCSSDNIVAIDLDSAQAYDEGPQAEDRGGS